MINNNENSSEKDIISFRERLDVKVLEYIKENFQNPILDKLMVLFTVMGELGMLWIGIGLMLIMQEKYRNKGIVIFVTLSITTIIGEGVIKNIFQRKRPCHGISCKDLLIKKPKSYSFPSGHTASSIAAATVLSTFFTPYAIIFFGIAVLIAFSRMYLYVHYPTDILAGIALGVLCSQTTLYMLRGMII